MSHYSRTELTTTHSIFIKLKIVTMSDAVDIPPAKKNRKRNLPEVPSSNEKKDHRTDETTAVSSNNKHTKLDISTETTAATPSTKGKIEKGTSSSTETNDIAVAAWNDTIEDLFRGKKEKKKKLLEDQERKQKQKKVQSSNSSQQWTDDGLGGVFDPEGFTGRRTSDGDNVRIFKAHVLGGAQNAKAGTTPLCPFDCQCCFI
jgi:Eukaryotic protein of unknown function (DUF1764)